MACQLFASSAVRCEGEVEEGRDTVGKAGTRVEEARRRERGCRSLMMKIEQVVKKLGLKVGDRSRD